ncbi:457_t:CDS:1, partial [Ambispora gerdemannii]
MPTIEEEIEDPIREKDHNIGNDINNGNNSCTSKDKTMEQLDTCPKLELNIQVSGDEFSNIVINSYNNGILILDALKMTLKEEMNH